MVKKTYKELLEGLKYSDLGYTGERKPLTDPKYKQFTDTINKNKVIANTHIDSSLPPQMPQAQVSGPINKNRRNAVIQDTKGAEVSTVGGTSPTTVPTTQPETAPTTDTPLTIDSKYSDFVKWAKEHGVDSDKVLQDAMALTRTQYEQSRATYGLKAEQLAQAGLTNSGVSDNLERAAYAQKVQAEQAALGQKAALDQANKQGFAEYQEQQKQQQQQYTNLYQQLVDGYEDEYGNIHAGVSPEMAIAQLKFAGLTDETMIAEAQKAYGEYKAVYDQQQTDRQNAIAGIDSTTGGFSADSMFGKLFSGGMKEQEFFDTINQQYGIATDSYDEAIEALVQNKAITREQASMFYRDSFINAIDDIADSSENIKSLLKTDDNLLYTTIKEASESYKNGKMSKADWDAFRQRILSGNSDVAITITASEGKDLSGNPFTLTLEAKLGGSKLSVNFAPSTVDEATSKKLESLSNGTSYVAMNGKLYFKEVIRSGQNKGTVKWYEVNKGMGGTKYNNAFHILMSLAEQ